MLKHRSCVTLAAMLATSLGSTCLAQHTSGRDPGTGISADPPQKDEANIAEVIVTAQKREESIQSVPIVIAAASAQTLKEYSIQGLSGLGALVPGLQMSQFIGAGLPTLRGVGSTLNTTNVESPTATYIDGVYVAAMPATLFSFNNIEQIAVLKGPQGTLFGRNATGGVIQITTKKPSQEMSINAEVGYANYDTVSGNLYATTGLAQTLAFDIAAIGSRQNDGWGVNLTNGHDVDTSKEYAVRSNLLFTPGTETEIRLTAGYYYRNSSTGSSIVIYPGLLNADRVTRNRGNYDIYFPGGYDPQDAVRTGYGSLTVKHDFGAAVLTSVSSYSNSHVDYLFNQTGGQGNTILPPIAGDPSPPPAFALGLSTLEDQTTLTEEIQLASSSSSWIKWIGGFFYLHDKADLHNFIAPTTGGPGGPVAPFTPSVLFNHDVLNSYAAFGQATVPLWTSTRLTLGARVTDDKHQVSSANVTPGGPVRSRGGKSWSSPTWRVALDHDLAPDALAYISWNRGFKSGVFNPAAAASVTPANPETIDAFEAGIKSEFLQRRLRVNVGGFWYNDKDLQTRIVLQGGATTIINAAKSRNRGVDFDLQFVPINNLTFGLAAEYLDAKYQSFPTGFLYSSRLPGTVPPGREGGNNLVAPLDLAGYTLPRAPHFTQSASFAYKVPSSVGEFAVSGLYNHNSGFFWEQDDHLRQPAYDIVDASVSWTAPGRTWMLRVWGRNLMDERVFSIAASNRTSSYGLVDPPRTFGVTLDWNF